MRSTWHGHLDLANKQARAPLWGPKIRQYEPWNMSLTIKESTPKAIDTAAIPIRPPFRALDCEEYAKSCTKHSIILRNFSELGVSFTNLKECYHLSWMRTFQFPTPPASSCHKTCLAEGAWLEAEALKFEQHLDLLRSAGEKTYLFLFSRIRNHLRFIWFFSSIFHGQHSYFRRIGRQYLWQGKSLNV